MGSRVVASCGKLNLCRDLRWVAKWRKACVDLHANLISTKVCASIASQCKCKQALAKRSRKLTQVFNLPLLAIPFGLGLKLLYINLVYATQVNRTFRAR